MSTNKTHAKNLILNGGSYAANLLVSFFLSPFIVGSLDPASYGIWSLLNVFAGYMGVLDLGVRASVGRHIALYLGKGDAESLDETIRAGLAFFSVAGVVLVLAGFGLGWLFPHFFDSVPAEQHGTVRLLLPLMVLNVGITAIAAIYSSILVAHDRFDYARGIDVTVLIVRTGFTVLALVAGLGLWGLAGALLFSNVVALIGNFILARRQHEGLRSWPFLYSKPRLKEIIGYGLAAFLTRASLKIIGQTDLVIAGALLSVASVREYSVGAMMVYYSGTFVGIIENTLFPALQRAAGREDMGVVRWLYLRQLRIAMLFSVPAFIGMATFSRPFIRLWMMQPGFTESSVVVSAGVMTILALAKLPLGFVSGSVSVLSATGRIRTSANLTILEALLNIALSLLFTMGFGWGLYGIAASTLVATLLVRAIWIPVMACREVDVRLGQMLMEFILPAGLAALIFVGICFGVQYLLPPLTWPIFIANIALVLVLFCLFGIPLLLPKDYRQSIWQWLGKALVAS